MAADLPFTPFVLIDGSIETQEVISHVPFTVGRLPDRDLVLTHPWVSRRHAEFTYDGSDFYLVDSGSLHGTFLNGEKIDRAKLTTNDSIHFGSLDGPVLRFDVQSGNSGSTIRDLLGQIQSISSPNSDLEKLRWFLEAARKLNTVGAVDQILASLVETTLQLTKVERGYVFLRNEAGNLELAVGRSSVGESLVDDSTVSHSAIQQATRTAGEFIVTDTLTSEVGARSESMVAQSIRTVICIPLRSRRTDARRTAGEAEASPLGEILGVLYLDSRLNPGNLTAGRQRSAQDNCNRGRSPHRQCAACNRRRTCAPLPGGAEHRRRYSAEPDDGADSCIELCAHLRSLYSLQRDWRRFLRTGRG